MKRRSSRHILWLHRHLYAALYGLLISRQSAQRAHEFMIASLRLLDHAPLAVKLSGVTRKAVSSIQHIEAGGVSLSQALVLAAGFVKGDGFHSEDDALRAVNSNRNIVPGWRFVPALLGPVEFGSFTRFPRSGQHGRRALAPCVVTFHAESRWFEEPGRARGGSVSRPAQSATS